MLFSGAMNNIVPYSLSFDNSYGNKPLSLTEWNRGKVTRPCIASDGATVRNASTGQLSQMRSARKCAQEQTRDDFEKSRPINPTTSIRLQSGCQITRFVGGSNRREQRKTTHAVRHQWGLNRLLNQENSKNRDDHRHILSTPHNRSDLSQTSETCFPSVARTRGLCPIACSSYPCRGKGS